jgi:hypothetical protein
MEVMEALAKLLGLALLAGIAALVWLVVIAAADRLF